MTGQQLTTEDIAEMFRVDPYTVREWTRSGALRGCKVGRRWYYEADDVQAFKDRGESRPPERRRRRRAVA